MEIIKIGGAVLKNPDGFSKMTSILNTYSSRPLLLVVSAFYSSTRELEKAAHLASENMDISAALTIINDIINQHKEFAEKLISKTENLNKLLILFNETKELLTGYLNSLCLTRELTPRTLDLILSKGELFALNTVSYYLNEKDIKHTVVDATEIIRTDGTFGSAKPDIEATAENVKKYIAPNLIDNKIVLIQGFVAKSTSGETTTMGIESSNLTALILAFIPKAKELTYWTDTEGIRTADPKIVEMTRAINDIDYDQADDYAESGLKLIFPGTIQIARKCNMSLIYKSAFNPEAEATIINSASTNKLPIIISKSKIALVTLKPQSANSSITELLQVQSTFSIKLNKTQYFLIAPSKIPNEDYGDSLDIKKYYTLITVFHISKEKTSEIMTSLNHFAFSFCIYDESSHSLRIALEDKLCNEVINTINNIIYK